MHFRWTYLEYMTSRQFVANFPREINCHQRSNHRQSCSPPNCPNLFFLIGRRQNILDERTMMTFEERGIHSETWHDEDEVYFLNDSRNSVWSPLCEDDLSFHFVPSVLIFRSPSTSTRDWRSDVVFFFQGIICESTNGFVLSWSLLL